jgi:hypothetical protein
MRPSSWLATHDREGTTMTTITRRAFTVVADITVVPPTAGTAPARKSTPRPGERS